MTSPTISVVVPVYNGVDYLEKTVQSILKQSLRDFELVLINDGSQDESQKLLERLSSEDSRVKVFHKENGGVACARNYGIGKSTGEFIAFCDQDDLWHTEKLAKQLPLFEDSQVGLVYCGAVIEHTNLGKKSEPGFESKHRGDIFDQLIQQNMITCCSAIARKTMLQQCGGFDDDRSLMGVDDWHLWLKLALICKADFVEEHLCTHVFHGDNYSLNDGKMHDAEIICLDKIFPLTITSGRSPNWNSIRRNIHLKYAQSYLYTSDFKLAADTYQRAYREQPSPSALIKWLIYRILPAPVLHFLQNQKRRIAR
ncbi:MAG: glycosyltransferase family A protein [Motiliproteus sp.]